MSAPNKHIEVDAVTAKALAEQAQSLGMSVAEFLRDHFCGSEALPIDDIDAWLDSLTDGMEGVLPLAADFSTRDLYSDHD